MIQVKIKLEIMAGYLILVFCLTFIVWLIHEEQGKKSTMERQEQYWQGKRQLTNRASRPSGYIIIGDRKTLSN